jgi:small-conductance mechanosensitive channel
MAKINHHVFQVRLLKYIALLPLLISNNTHAVEDSSQSAVLTQASSMTRELMAYWSEFLAALPLAAIGLLIAVIMFFLAKPISAQLIKPISYMSSSVLIRKVIRRVISLLFILLGVYIFLRFAGLGEFAIAVLSGTGVVGLIIGFAFQDIAENFISSLLLSIQKPFKIDDVIEVEGHMGVVKQVTARATTLVDFDGNHIQIPNSTVYKNVIRNITANPKTRGSFVIGIGYDSSIVKSQQLAMEILTSTPAVLNDPEPQVLVDILASSTINLKIYFWIDTHQHSLLKVKSLLMRTILRKLEHAGISMPDDAREIVFPDGIIVKQDNQQNITSEQPVKPVQEKPEQEKQVKEQQTTMDSEDDKHVDLSSETDEIRQQAKQARDPERGENIL